MMFGRALTPVLVVSAHWSAWTRSVPSFSAVASSRVRVDAIVSPDWCAAAIVGISAAGSELTIAPEFNDAPRRGL